MSYFKKFTKNVKTMTHVITLMLLMCILHSGLSQSVEIEPNINKLSRKYIPLQYNIELTPDLIHNTFEGSMSIHLKLNERTSAFYLYLGNLKEVLNISEPIMLASRRNISPKKGNNAKDDFQQNGIFLVALSRLLEIGNWNIDFNHFSGRLKSSNHFGFYSGEYHTKDDKLRKFAATQFKPNAAQNAFPCFDEPFFRSKFTIRINRPNDYNCISNGLLKSSTNISENLIQDEFEETKSIPSHAVAFLISTMTLTNKTQNSIHQVLARPEIIKRNKHKYFVDTLNRIFVNIEKVITIKYPLGHFYHAILPSDQTHHEAAANWGLNYYKESLIFCLQECLEEKQELATVAIASSLLEQWFGILVSVDEWSWVWITEGLKTYLSYKIVDMINPEWKIMDRLVIEFQRSMMEDSKCCAESLNFEAVTSSEIRLKFNQVTIYKGAALMGMLEAILTPSEFLIRINQLLRKMKYKSIRPEDFYQNIERGINLKKHSHLSVNIFDVISTWDSQVGYPVLQVTRNYGNNEQTVSLTQTRFMDGDLTSAVWSIPINYATSKVNDFHNIKASRWLHSETGKIIVKSLQGTDWLIINKRARFYYRVNYDKRNWNLIIEALTNNHKTIHRLNRMQIILDSFNLANIGLLSFTTPLKICSYLKNETEYAPLKAFKEVFKSLEVRLAGTKTNKELRKLLIQSLNAVLKKFDSILVTHSTEKYHHRHSITLRFIKSWLCELGNCEHISMQRSAEEEESNLDKYIECNSVKNNKNKIWNDLFENYKSFEDSNFYKNSFYALSCTTDGNLLTKLLRFIVSSDKHHLKEAINAIIYQGSHNGINSVMKFSFQNFEEVLIVLGEKDFADTLTGLGSKITSNEQLKQLEKFSNAHKQYRYLLKPSINRAKENVQWKRRYLHQFQKELGGSSEVCRICPNNVIIVFVVCNLLTIKELF